MCKTERLSRNIPEDEWCAMFRGSSPGSGLSPCVRDERLSQTSLPPSVRSASKKGRCGHKTFFFFKKKVTSQNSAFNEVSLDCYGLQLMKKVRLSEKLYFYHIQFCISNSFCEEDYNIKQLWPHGLISSMPCSINAVNHAEGETTKH